MSNLIESILSEDFVSASELFESRMQQIAEHKLLETKKQIQAEGMVGMGKPIAQARKDIEARGMTPRRASDVYPDPRGNISTKPKAKKPTSDSDILTNLSKQWKSAKFGERKAAVKMVRKAAKAYQAGQPSDLSKPKVPIQEPPKGTKEMSPELRRSKLDKAREAKTKGLMDQGKYGSARRLMTRGEIKKTNRKDFASGAKGFLGRIASGLGSLYEE